MICTNGAFARQRRFCRAVAMTCAGFGAISALVVLTSPPVQALAGDLEAITKASNLDSDPQDFRAIAEVCTRCHAASQFLTTPRSSNRWQQVYDEMSALGAIGTDDQLDRVVAYIQKNLTVINVNTSPDYELGPTLQVSDNVVAEIITRRTQRHFVGIDDLGKVPGIDRSVLEKLSAKNRVQF
jgi:DNA uptake protein ComE-like DNA-binding protein